MKERLGPIRSALAMLLLPLACAVTAAERWGLEALMQGLAAGDRPPQRYTEIRESAFLQIPIVSHGTLRILPDGSLVKEKHAPGFERITIGRDRIDLENADGGKRSFSLNELPGLTGFTTGLTALFADDPESLRSNFSTELRGGPNNWWLRLVPVGERSAATVRHIQLKGGGGTVREIRIVEGNGDSTLLELEAAVQ